MHWPASVLATIAAQVMTGGSVSWMVTVKEHVALPPVLEAEQVTMLVPTGKADPDAGSQITLGSGEPVALGVNVAIAEH